MAAITVKTASYTDDLSNIAGVAIALQTDDEGNALTDDEGNELAQEKGASLPNRDRVSIRLMDGETVWYSDTSRTNPLIALLKAQGTKQKKRGAKVKA